jgi:uncharacterized protein YjbJ (UPF0337 family)
MTLKDRMKNMLQMSKGKAKETTGRATGNASMTHEGEADQVMGHVKQAGEEMKNALGET